MTIKESKGKLTGVIVVIAVVIAVVIYFMSGLWPIRFKNELDAFFGEGNWEKISSETNTSMMYTVHHYTSDGLYNYDSDGTYTKWYILFTRDDEEEIWTISNHTYKINHSKYSILSADRYSAKQALVQQLMDISCEVAAEKVQYDLLSEILNEEQIESLRVSISYRNGNPSPTFYNRLFKQDWFNVENSTAENYLKTDLYEFYIDILAYDYKFNQLSDEDQADLLNSLDEIEQLLLDTYGEYAAYEIYLGEGYSAEAE
ncbi:MAG: hypothetical protein LUC89_01335 [Oscillospiraceae bacterium]|nr:hypothetical protein [Oscillospiraceae bacterium]